MFQTVVFQVILELALHETRQLRASFGQMRDECRVMLLHDSVEQRLLRPMALVVANGRIRRGLPCRIGLGHPSHPCEVAAPVELVNADDPLYAVRLAFVGMLSYVAVTLLNPALPPVIAALPVGMVGAQRKAFNFGTAIGGPLAMIVLVYLMTWLVEWLQPMPLVYVGAMWLTYFMGYRMILKTGAPAGMLIIIVAVLLSVMGMHGNATAETLRDAFVQASLVSLVLGPLAYFIFPARTREKHVDTPVPASGNITTGAVIRASVLLGMSFWLYAVMQPSDMMMAVIAAMVLVFPTRHAVYFEARQRILATLYGAALAIGVLLAFTVTSHLVILLGLIFLGGLWLGSRMLSGPQPSNVYQYGLSVMLSLIAGALSTQDAGYATFTRIVLTLAGAFGAALAIALLDRLTRWSVNDDLDAKAGMRTSPPTAKSA